MRPHGALSLAKHAPRNGARVLDVGCGRGESTLDLARLVGPKGSVVGLDTSGASVEAAGQAARSADARNVAFVRGDARTFRVEAVDRFDLVFTRIGETALGDPETAFGNLRRASKPGSRLLAVTWRAMALNSWATVTAEVARRCTRSFALADPKAAEALLVAAGYTAVTLEAIDAPVVLGPSVEEAAASLLRLDGAGAPAASERVVADVRAALRPFVTSRGVVMASSSWCITATNAS